ncbi:MAG: hypothetical protein HYV26_17595, partial [Candidatus Hydrogenedentes bacterium]|nr:hypothetical protein [Candidatus Hydrogenedentota bacterium]
TATFRAKAMLRRDDVDVVRFLPAAPGAVVHLRVKGSAPVTLRKPGAPLESTQERTLLLDPSDGAFSGLFEQATSSGPLVEISYTAPEHAGAAARPLTEAERAELEALGYLHE